MSFAPLNLLVTGGAGFIGTNFVRHWLAKTQEGRVIVFDALTYAGNLDNLSGLERNPRFAFVRGDICDEPTVRALMDAASDRHHRAFRGGVACRSLHFGPG